MKTDTEIAEDAARFKAVVGVQHAIWYEEACRVEGSGPEQLWACRYRESVRRAYTDITPALAPIDRLVELCEAMPGGGGKDVQDAIEELRKAFWWRDGKGLFV